MLCSAGAISTSTFALKDQSLNLPIADIHKMNHGTDGWTSK
jgi:hypothetical protein